MGAGVSSVTSQLRQLTIFDGVDEPLLDEVATGCDLRSYGDGEVVCLQGDVAQHVFVVERGEVRVEAGGEILATRRSGEVVGEQAFINGRPRSATIRAVGAARILRIPKVHADSLLMNPQFLRNLLGAVSEKLSASTADRAWRYRERRLLFAEFRAHVAEPVLQELLAS